MQLHFLGANRQVTGSRYLLEACGRRIMIDCGMFQERCCLARNWEPSPVPPGDVDALLLTHGHLDHSGLLPRFVANGFEREIHATHPSVDLARLVLEDSARIQAEDAAYKKRRHEREGRKGKHREVALYTSEDVERTLRLFRGVAFDRPIELGPGLEARFHDSGHILGSAMIEITATENGQTRRLIMSGDVGPLGRPLMNDPEPCPAADYVVMESTYGDRLHERDRDVDDLLAEIINDTAKRGGNVIIPTFAIDRAQEIIFHLGMLQRDDRIPKMAVFLDSPMAVSATDIYKRYAYLLDEATQKVIDDGHNPFHFEGFRTTRRRDESKQINKHKAPCVIMAGSGMCTGGRVKHHLRLNLPRPESTVLFVGYQASHTLGRRILEGADEVRIHGQMQPIRAQIKKINGLSAHADREDLFAWLGGPRPAPKRLFLTHGEARAAERLATRIRDEHGWNVEIPDYRTSVDL